MIKAQISKQHIKALFSLSVKVIIPTILLSCSGKPFPCATPFLTDRRPDTVTVYKFIENEIPKNKIAGVKTLSNYAFKTASFTLRWYPISTTDVSAWVDRSIRSSPEVKVSDTLVCNIFSTNYTVIVSYSKGIFVLWMYDKGKSGAQNVFLASMRSGNKIQDHLTFISASLQY